MPIKVTDDAHAEVHFRLAGEDKTDILTWVLKKERYVALICAQAKKPVMAGAKMKPKFDFGKTMAMVFYRSESVSAIIDKLKHLEKELLGIEKVDKQNQAKMKLAWSAMKFVKAKKGWTRETKDGFSHMTIHYRSKPKRTAKKRVTK